MATRQLREDVRVVVQFGNPAELLTVLRRDRPTPAGPGARCDPSKVAGSVD